MWIKRQEVLPFIDSGQENWKRETGNFTRLNEAFIWSCCPRLKFENENLQ